MPSFTVRPVLSQPTIRSIGATTVTSDDTEVTRTIITTVSEDTMGAPIPWFWEQMRPKYDISQRFDMLSSKCWGSRANLTTLRERYSQAFGPFPESLLDEKEKIRQPHQ